VNERELAAFIANQINVVGTTALLCGVLIGVVIDEIVRLIWRLSV
jgi:hypothetical protein